MNSADKMFKELDYTLIEETKELVVYGKMDDHIVFDKRYKLIHHYRLVDLYGDYKTKLPMALTYSELLAINQQVDELGWNEWKI